MDITPPKDLMDGAIARFMSLLSSYNPQGIANTMWSFASLGYFPGKRPIFRSILKLCDATGPKYSLRIQTSYWCCTTTLSGSIQRYISLFTLVGMSQRWVLTSVAADLSILEVWEVGVQADSSCCSLSVLMSFIMPLFLVPFWYINCGSLQFIFGSHNSDTWNYIPFGNMNKFVLMLQGSPWWRWQSKPSLATSMISPHSILQSPCGL